MAIVICYAIVYPCGSNDVEDAIIVNVGIQGTPVPLFYEALIGDHFTSTTTPFTSGVEYYVDSICCSASCLVGFPVGPYPTAPSQSNLTVISGPCIINTCVGILTPCDGGNPIYLGLGTEGQFVYSQWLPLEGQLLTFSTPGYSGTYYLSDICCGVSAAIVCGIDQSLFVTPPTVDQNLGQGPCFTPPPPPDPPDPPLPPTAPTCCVSILPCDGGNPITIYIGTDTSEEYDTWDELIGNTITIDLPEFIGTFIVDSICCIGETILDPCLNSAPCLLNSIVIDLADVIDLGPIPCPIPCYALTNCKSNQTILTSTNLWEYVNSVITIEEYPGCWQVSLGEGCVDEDPVTLISGYDDCECCLPPEPSKYTRILPAPNRVFYKVPSQCDVTTNVKFANAYYNIFKQLRYGIASNCEVDEHKILLKKELNDLAAIYDPTACVITTPPVPVVCAEPEGNPFIPPTPPQMYYYAVSAPETCNSVCLSGTPTDTNCDVFTLELNYDLYASAPLDVTYFGFNYNGAQVWGYAPFVVECIPGVSCIGSTIVTGLTSSNITYTDNSDPKFDPCTLFGG